ADAQRERQDGDEAEPRALEEHPEAVLEVLKEHRVTASGQRVLVSGVENALFELALALLAAVFLDHAAVEQVDRAIGMTRVARIVRDHADGRPFAMQLAEEPHRRLAGAPD